MSKTTAALKGEGLKMPGEPAPRGRLLRPEVIGPDDCPLLHRWTLFEHGPRAPKVMVHHFLPNADDRAIHDHPRAFITLVLRGGYLDLVPCGDSLIIGDRMRAGMIRYRPAEHAHRTRVGPRGAWTLVVMGPLRRRWGFWVGRRWMFWRDFEHEFGFGMRCGDEEQP